MNEEFTYGKKGTVSLLKPMSMDKSIVRTTLLPSLMNVYEYNIARNMEDINIYEISNTYANLEDEDTKLAILMSGNYMNNSWQGMSVKSDFYILKGIVSNLLEYLGYQDRYSFVEADDIKDMHPGATAIINIDNRQVGYMGRVHPSIAKNEIYALEISVSTLAEKKTRSYKFKELNKFPSIVKDVAFVMPNNMNSSKVEKEIKRSSGKILKSIDVFDLYTGENVGEDEKSIAYSLVYEDDTRTLTTEEVNDTFNKMIDDVCQKLDLKIRN